MISRFLTVALLLSLPAWGVEKTWNVPSRVSVTCDELKLADLVTGAPAGWEEVALGQGPRPGGERVLNRAWILQRAKEVGADKNLEVPETVTVARAGRALAREEVERAVEEALNPKGTAKPVVRVASIGLPGPVPEGEVTFRVLPPAGDLSSPVTVWVEAVSQGRVVGKAWARVEPARFQSAVVLTRDLKRGDVLRAGDLEVRAERASRTQTLTEPGRAIGFRLVRNLPAGSQVSAYDVEEVPGVERGQSVQLVAQVGSIVATTTGRALERARVGEGVRVENVGSGKVVQGVLREAGVVEIRSEFGRQP